MQQTNKEINKNVKDLKSDIKVVSSINNTIKTLETNMSSKMEVECSSLSAKEKGLEAKARANKANNIVMFNVPELNSDDVEKSYKRDVEAIRTIFSGEIDLEKEDIKSMFRIGLNKDATKPRPIIIKFTSIEKKTEVLQLKDLTYIDSNTEYNICITHDRTKKEQDEHKNLVKKLKERKENGEEDLVIRNGKIIQLRPFRPNPQLFWG